MAQSTTTAVRPRAAATPTPAPVAAPAAPTEPEVAAPAAASVLPPDVADELHALRAQVEELQAQLSADREKIVARDAENGELRRQLMAQRDEFDRAWKEREAVIEAQGLATAAAPRPKRRYAAASFRAPVQGELTEFKAGDRVPENADLTGHPEWVVEER